MPSPLSQTLAATTPPGRTTRHISRAAPGASLAKCITSWATERSKASSPNGSSSAAPTRTSTPGCRSRQDATKLGGRVDADDAVLPEPVGGDGGEGTRPTPHVERPVAAFDPAEVGNAGASSESSEFSAFSARELQVVTLISAGLSNLEIAGELYLSVNSVKTYMRAAYRKIGLTRRSQVVAWAFDKGYSQAHLDPWI